jgi:hypothetical protein
MFSVPSLHVDSRHGKEHKEVQGLMTVKEDSKIHSSAFQ